jgi:hypothetical protein
VRILELKGDVNVISVLIMHARLPPFILSS